MDHAKQNILTEEAGRTLRVASFQGEEATVRTLLAGGVEVDATDSDGWTALMLAAKYGRAEIVRLLLEHGAQVDARTRHGHTALNSCRGNLQIVSILFEYGTDLANAYPAEKALLFKPLIQKRLQDVGILGDSVEPGWTRLASAVRIGNWYLVLALLQNGAEVDGRSPFPGDWTALMYAALHGQIEMAKLLLRHGADRDAVCAMGKTALDFARRSWEVAVRTGDAKRTERMAAMIALLTEEPL